MDRIICPRFRGLLYLSNVHGGLKWNRCNYIQHGGAVMGKCCTCYCIVFCSFQRHRSHATTTKRLANSFFCAAARTHSRCIQALWVEQINTLKHLITNFGWHHHTEAQLDYAGVSAGLVAGSIAGTMYIKQRTSYPITIQTLVNIPLCHISALFSWLPL